MKLSELKAGEQGRILLVKGEGALRRRLMDMGLTPGTSVFIHKVAPLGDPIELHLRGYALTLRKEDAANIEVSRMHLHETPNALHMSGKKRRRFKGGVI